MTAGRAAVVAAMVTVLVPPASAFAQQPPSLAVRRLELSIGAGILGGGALGAQDANLRANNVDPTPFRLFSTETRMGVSPTLDMRAGFAFTRRYGVEGGVSFGSPELRTSLSDDVEGGDTLVVVEDVTQYFMGAAFVVALEELRFGTLTPIVTAGGGYLRQLHEGRTVVDDGRFFQGSIGVRHTFASGGQGLVTETGVRADVRLYLLDGGIAVEEGLRPQGAVSGSFFVTF
jgi:hypothetical protein